MAPQLPSLLFLLLALPQAILSAPAEPEITMGPQAYASFMSMDSFSTLKPCAQGCLRYNGPYHCGLVGYMDLGKNIGCGCSPQNYCFCDTREAAAVTSYIQSCIVTWCETPGEQSAALDLYNGYCQTATVLPASTTSKPYSFTGKATETASGSEATGDASDTATQTGSQSAAGASSSSTETSSSTSAPPKKGGLGIGAIIGIAVGGVVILLALLCAGCCLIWRKRRNAKKAGAGNQGFTAGGTPHENQYVAPNQYVEPTGGAMQLDGAGVFGKKNDEKVTYGNPQTGAADYVSPQGTPTPVYVQPHGNYQEQNTHPTAHEMYGNGSYQKQPGANVYEAPSHNHNAHEKP